ncbi:TPA: hypothetical protein DCW38_08535 [candidate division WOR-3 bacterium]|uniref:Glycosyltransferase family 1 protein n=1 Tax=candidate division WOR-3 bacterium TaxID=2052148 RepID=A0A350HCE0_UNCW3|nr:hypothetical protein [candidate division WOR-3 bacterium]
MKYSSVVCFAGGDWWYHHTHSYNHLMKQFSKDVKVLYVNSLPVGSVGGAKSSKRILNKIKSIARFFKKAQKNLYVFTPIFIPMKDSGFLLEVNSLLLKIQIKIIISMLKMKDPLIWIANPNGYIFLRKSKKLKSVYQIVDKVSAYRHAGEMVKTFDSDLCRDSDLIFTPGRMLYEEKKTQYPEKVFRIKHGVDTEHFVIKSDIMPYDFPQNGKKTFTYWGSIDYKKVDYSLLKYLAENGSEFNILLIGRVFDFKMEDFKEYKHIYFLREKKYEELPLYAFFSDGFLIPWDKDDEMNRNASPIKLREYLSTGKPVIATYIPEFEEFRDYIMISRDNREFLGNMAKALKEDSEIERKKRMEFVKSNSWRNVYEDIRKTLSDFPDNS